MIGVYFDCDKGDSDMIYDARGVRIPFPLSGNLATGEVIRIDTDDNGDMRLDCQGFPVVMCKSYLSPLRMMPREDEILCGVCPDLMVTL